MLLLSIDTAAQRCDVCLAEGKDSELTLRAQSVLNQKHAHSEKLIKLIESVLAQSDTDRSQIDAVAISIGPGSFTGLRVGLSTAKALCYALNIPLMAVPTFDAIAAKAATLGSTILIYNVARRNEFYFARYVDHKMRGSFAVIQLDEVPATMTPGAVIVGDAYEIVAALGDDVMVAGADHAYSDSYFVAKQGYAMWSRKEFTNVDEVTPLYLKPFAGVMG